MTNECKQQFTLRISQANPTEMIVILYEMTICYLEESEEALKSGDMDAFKEGIRKTRGCLKELMASLHMEYEPAAELMQLYLFCLKRLANGEVKMDAQALNEVKRVIRPLHDAYDKIAPQNQQGPVMNNSQTVYAGLTYGRNTLTENMTNQSANRGMLV